VRTSAHSMNVAVTRAAVMMLLASIAAGGGAVGVEIQFDRPNFRAIQKPHRVVPAAGRYATH
jgi:hypothetical protein